MGTVTGVAFYTKEGYEQLLIMADDRSALCDTYEEWLDRYQSSLIKLAANGIDAQPYLMDMFELNAWCKSKGGRNTGANRASFVSEKMSTRNS